MYIKLMDTCIKTRVLTGYCCADSGESVMEETDKRSNIHLQYEYLKGKLQQ